MPVVPEHKYRSLFLSGNFAVAICNHSEISTSVSSHLEERNPFFESQIHKERTMGLVAGLVEIVGNLLHLLLGGL